jgi:hypothetical protein
MRAFVGAEPPLIQRRKACRSLLSPHTPLPQGFWPAGKPRLRPLVQPATFSATECSTPSATECSTPRYRHQGVIESS